MVAIMYHLDELLYEFLKKHGSSGKTFIEEWKESTKETRKGKQARSKTKNDACATMTQKLQEFTEIIGEKYRANNFSVVPMRLASLQSYVILSGMWLSFGAIFLSSAVGAGDNPTERKNERHRWIINQEWFMHQESELAASRPKPVRTGGACKCRSRPSRHHTCIALHQYSSTV